MMSKNHWLALGACIAVVTVGFLYFQNQPPKATGVAVVDLEEVARVLGRDKEIAASLQQRKVQLSEQLITAQQQVNKELAQLRANLGPNPTQQAANELQQKAAQYQQQLVGMQNQATSQLSEHGLEVMREFRESARPVAVDVAHERGFATVLTRNDGVLFAFDETCDITQEVIARMKAQAPQTTPAAPSGPAVAEQPAANPVIQASATSPASAQ
ncbi:MAG: OmpH family outer membrane protein [Planctomycetaceae bacterium]|nr:OmpH family outer membrane protein [Planctomycetaceae bacterium]MCB9951572.1 OmpH family outer membrane protein [Planctomycetaceae bacterium]